MAGSVHLTLLCRSIPSRKQIMFLNILPQKPDSNFRISSLEFPLFRFQQGALGRRNLYEGDFSKVSKLFAHCSNFFVMGECFRFKKPDFPSPRSGHSRPTSASLMDSLLGLLRIRVKKGIDLAVRDVRSSDPYVVVKMGKQKFKTRVIRKCVNPEWNEDLTLSVLDPNIPVKLTVYDHDTFSKDDKMGEAEFSIIPFLEAMKMKHNCLPSGTVVSRIQPGRQNCLAEESCIVWEDGKVIQDMCLRLKNVERGEVEIKLQWIDVPGAKGISSSS